jgi:hypothetical protein
MRAYFKQRHSTAHGDPDKHRPGCLRRGFENTERRSQIYIRTTKYIFLVHERIVGECVSVYSVVCLALNCAKSRKLAMGAILGFIIEEAPAVLLREELNAVYES